MALTCMSSIKIGLRSDVKLQEMTVMHAQLRSTVGGRVGSFSTVTCHGTDKEVTSCGIVVTSDVRATGLVLAHKIGGSGAFLGAFSVGAEVLVSAVCAVGSRGRLLVAAAHASRVSVFSASMDAHISSLSWRHTVTLPHASNINCLDWRADGAYAHVIRKQISKL
ncbi:hypothetical protein BC830DRAFT_765313 [Chytriomyces sp. MP71]|nr:hypothetical protein BC830DRAFT_765313 [Chytriomyces sp. MP71]